MTTAVAEFPEKLGFLFEPHRYKVLYGGRGSGKSWGIARALLTIGVSRPVRVLCTREVQKSIDQSVHQLLRDQIDELGFSDFYEVQRTTIKGMNGSEFYFSGLSDQTALSLKSYEGVDVCWCEEAQSITKESWKILIPTIRRSGSEIWVSYNPQLESDETHQRFVLNPPPNAKVVKMNYTDNPWFHDTEMPEEMRHARETLPEEEFRHIWLGETLPAVEGAIYFRAMSQLESDGRIKPVPYDPMLKTHVVFDLGYNDAMTIIVAQKASSEVRIIHYIEGRQRTLPDYSQELKDLSFSGQKPDWGNMYLPHDGFAKRHQTGMMDADVMRQLGWSVFPVPNTSVKNGINAAQMMFPRVYIDESCKRLVECLKRYRWNITKTGEGQAPLHDEYSHGADAFRYLALVESDMRNDAWGGEINYPKLNYA